MVRIQSRDFTTREYERALNADRPTRKQQAVLAVWGAIEAYLIEQMNKDGLFKLGYDLQCMEAFHLAGTGRVNLAYTGVCVFEPDIEEVLRNSEDAKAIIALLQRGN